MSKLIRLIHVILSERRQVTNNLEIEINFSPVAIKAKI